MAEKTWFQVSCILAELFQDCSTKSLKSMVREAVLFASEHIHFEGLYRDKGWFGPLRFTAPAEKKFGPILPANRTQQAQPTLIALTEECIIRRNQDSLLIFAFMVSISVSICFSLL